MIDWGRWSRLKRENQEGEAIARWRAALAALPPDGDLTPFLAPDVPEVVRQEALQRLWRSGQFGAPDQLDSEFVDAASHPVLSEAEAKSLVQWQAVTAPLSALPATEEAETATGGGEPGRAAAEGAAGPVEPVESAAPSPACDGEPEDVGEPQVQGYNFLKSDVDSLKKSDCM
ncbi:hypothetical protein JCM16106_08310 [Hydrogenophilus islandicus]